jgi:hypothetical protein
MKIKKSKARTIKNPLKNAPAPRQSDKGENQKSGGAAEELFGVHIISSEDIENHFGVSETESDSPVRQESEMPGESKNEK